MHFLDSRNRQEVSPASTKFWDLGERAQPSTPQPSTWVRLVNPPTAFSFDEAWLLCPYSETQWVAWIPDYGEILLNTNEFY